MAFLKNGAAALRAAIADAKKSGADTLTFSGEWEIEETVFLPSDFTLIFKDCHLRMADGTFCRMFCNEHALGPDVSYDRPDRHIRLLGEGKAILDGGNYNGLGEWPRSKIGKPEDVTLNNLILFRNLDGYEIAGLHLCNQRYWAINQYYCRGGYLHDLTFCSDDRTMMPDGTLRHGLDRKDYIAVYIRNSDGIDFRVGCHDCTVERIGGFTEDDTVALTALPEPRHPMPDASQDIHDITVRHVHSSSFCSNVRLLNQGGPKMYHITVDDVCDTEDGSHFTCHSEPAVKIGDTLLYAGVQNEYGDMHDITVRNVTSAHAPAAVFLAGYITRLKLENIKAAGICEKEIENRAEVD